MVVFAIGATTGSIVELTINDTKEIISQRIITGDMEVGATHSNRLQTFATLDLAAEILYNLLVGERNNIEWRYYIINEHIARLRDANLITRFL